MHNYAVNWRFSKSLTLWKKIQHGETRRLPLVDVFLIRRRHTHTLKKLFVTRAEETDEMLREVERKMERLRVLSSSHDDDAGDRREIGGWQ